MSGLLQLDVKSHFSRFLASKERLHVAAHSHHPWPDVSFGAHRQAWRDAAEHHDDKWEHIQGRVVPLAKKQLARRLRLPSSSSLVFAPNTLEFVARILSCLEAPARVLTTDAEFHSFRRQIDRLAEDGIVEVERIPAQPFETFTDRFAEAAARGGHDLVFLSSVQFDSAYVVSDLDRIVASVPDDDTFVVVDGYHQFMAMPFDCSRIAERAFVLAGGYKYAMAGEGVCFLHVPDGYGPRPTFTGWYAEFGDLEQAARHQVAYTSDANRFAGATYDPSGIYRLVAVQHWLTDLGIDEAAIHGHVAALQDGFLERVMDLDGLPFGLEQLVPGLDALDRGNFVTFATDRAGEVREALAKLDVMVDHRGDRLRFGFGIYHDASDVDVLAERLGRVASML